MKPTLTLITDLKQRRLLDEVIVQWTGEFGRLPITEGADGRDHTRRNLTHSGRPERLTDPEVTGARVVNEVLA